MRCFVLLCSEALGAQGAVHRQGAKVTNALESVWFAFWTSHPSHQTRPGNDVGTSQLMGQRD